MSRAAPLAVHLAPGHVPFDTRVFHKEAKTLAAAGYRVVVVAPHDQEEEVDGVRVVPLARGRGSRGARFLLRPVRLGRIAWRLKADLYHVHDFEALPVALVLALAGRRVVIDSHEDYPRLVLGRAWIPKRLRRPLSWAVARFERVVVARVAAVISAEDEAAKRFRRGALVVRNYPLASEFPEPGRPLAERAPVAVYIGDLTTERGVPSMLGVINRLNASDPDLGARLVLGGRVGTPGLQEQIESGPAATHMDYRGFLDRTGVRAALGEARVGLILLQPIPKFTEGAVPVKLFEYLAAGLPVVASDFPEIRRIVNETGGGVLVDPEDENAVQAAVEHLLRNPDAGEGTAERARKIVLAGYTWTTEAERLLGLYRDLIGEAGPRSRPADQPAAATA